jgi:trehalose/maltose transport system permease protein
MVKKERAWLQPWLFSLPALTILIALTIIPLGRTIRDSFTNAHLGISQPTEWIGLKNYSYLLRDPDWWHSVQNTLIFTVCSVLLETILGLGIALLLHSNLKGKGALRTAVLIPWAIPAVVSARIWSWMFNDLYGVINEILSRLGLISSPVAWLADPTLTMATLVTVDVWKTTPFMALLILAGLQSIPTSVHEASQVDGASAWREFASVTLPLLRPAIGVAVLFRMLDALRIFDLPFVLTSNSKSSSVISIYARQQMVDFQDVGYGSAAAFLIFCMTAIIAVIYLSTARKQLGLER